MAKHKAKTNKFITGAVTAAMVATAVVPVASAATEVTFSDVPATDTHYKNINEAVGLGLFKGYTDGTFKPYNTLTRANVAKVLANYVVGQEKLTYSEYIAKHDLVNKVTPFADVPSTHSDKELYNASLIVKDSGIFTGSNNNLMPTKAIQRQQLAKVLVNAFGLKDLEGDLSKVTDNDKAFDEFIPFINILSENGVTAVENFRPAETVLRGQMASFLNRAYDVVNPVNAETAIASVKAITSKSINVSFTGNPADLTATDFNVTGGLTVVDVNVSGKNATITFSRDMVDGAKYELQLLDGDGEVSSKAAFEYVLGQVSSIVVTKSKFEVGEEVSKFLKVYDDKGIEISTADYNIVDVESSNTAVVGNTVKAPVVAVGTANLRFTIEYKDGSKTKSDFIRVDVDEPVTAAVAGFELGDSAKYANTVDYKNNGSSAKTAFYVSDKATYLHVYADDSQTNPEIKPLDLSTNADYVVTTKNPTVVSVSEKDGQGVKLSPKSKGKATIEITGPNNYKKTISVEVKEDPIFKDLVVSATSLKLSDEAKTLETIGVDRENIELDWVDQHGKKWNLGENLDTTGLTAALTTGEVAAQEQILSNVIVPGDKVVISTTANAFELDGTTSAGFDVQAVKEKTVNNASIRVSYYADANANRATAQKTIATTVVDVNANDAAADYEAAATPAAIDADGPKLSTKVTAFALDKNGNRIDDVTSDIILTFNEAVSVPEQQWFALAGNTATFNADAWKYLTEEGALKLNYTVAGNSNPHNSVSISYTNSFKAPEKAVVKTSPVLVDLTTSEFGGNITAEELLFGKILKNSPELVIDNAAPVADSSIAIKKGFDGYANTPLLSFLDNSGKAVVSGAGLYGLLVNADTTGNGYISLEGVSYDSDAQFNVEYTLTNAKDLNQSNAGALNNQLSVANGEDQAAFTLVITKVTVVGDPRVNTNNVKTAKNLLDAAKSVNVILKAGEGTVKPPVSLLPKVKLFDFDTSLPGFGSGTVVVTLDTANPENYTVTVKGTELTYNAGLKAFSAELVGTNNSDYTASDVVISEKVAPVMPAIKLFDFDTSLPGFGSGTVVITLDTANPENYTVTVKGTELTYNAGLKAFSAELVGTNNSDYTASDAVVTSK